MFNKTLKKTNGDKSLQKVNRKKFLCIKYFTEKITIEKIEKKNKNNKNSHTCEKLNNYEK